MGITNRFTSEEYVEEKLADLEASLSPVQSDWNQNDETALDYIKNRPFYEGETIKEIIFNETYINLLGQTYIQAMKPLNIKIGSLYTVYINEQSYDAECYHTTDMGLEVFCLGDKNFEQVPFYLIYTDAIGLFNCKFKNPLEVDEVNIKIEEVKPNIITLDRKFIQGNAGENVAGKTYVVNDIEYTANLGAEIFNDYDKNIAIGQYAHAEGNSTIAMDIGSHAEGTHTIAQGLHSHAEGGGTIAFGINSHAEGGSTTANGAYSHAEGNGTIATDRQHVQGSYNIEDTSSLHIVGNGGLPNARSNAHTLDWSGNAWYQGDVYIGSTSGVNRDEGSKKLATEDFVNEQINAVPSQIQSDWNQEDENAVDYIKNRPFYGGNGEIEWIEILDTIVEPSKNSYIPFASISPCPDFTIGKTYKVIIDEEEYISVARLREHSDGDSIFIGAERKESILSSAPLNPAEGEPPFFITSMDNMGMALFVNYIELPIKVVILVQEQKIKLLDKKYINYIPGEKTEGKIVTYNNTEYTCATGAEIFNDYLSNLAIGQYSLAKGYNNIALGSTSHAEGSENTTLGFASHVEGGRNTAKGAYSHAEGHETNASGYGSHSEGSKTIASGEFSHSEGYYTKTESKYTHAEGSGTVASTVFSHTQGTYNIIDTPQEEQKVYLEGYIVGAGNVQILNLDATVYKVENTPSFDYKTGFYYIENPLPIEAKDLKENDIIVANNNSQQQNYFCIKSTEIIENDTKIRINCDQVAIYGSIFLGKYAHIVGNGSSDQNRSNAHTLDWNGNAWFAGDVRIGGTNYANATTLATQNDVNNINSLIKPLQAPDEENIFETTSDEIKALFN